MEKWKDINVEGFEGIYQISDLGRVRSLDRVRYQKTGTCESAKFIQNGIILKQGVRNGYLYINLRNEGNSKKVNIHRMVAMSFIENPLNKSLVNHKNGIKTDNRASNLEWCTAKENSQHALQTGLHKPSLSKESIKKANDAFCKETICMENNMVFKSAYEAARWINEILFSGTKKVHTIAAKVRGCRSNRIKSAYGYHFQFNK